MNIIETTFEKLPTKFLLIGFEGENLRATVRIDCSSVFAEYPNATPTLIVKPLFADAYPVVVDRNGTDVDWLITSEILSFFGDGEIQLVFYKDQVICKSAVSKIRVSRSLTVTGDMPDPVVQWIENANRKLAEVDAQIVELEEMVDTATDAAERAEQSASTASTAAEQAAGSAATATAKATEATNAAGTATAKASEAERSAQTATEKATAAAESERIATAKAGDATTAAGTATTKAEQATEAAQTATGKAGDASASATAAQASATNAASSATAASASETAAKASETAASTSASQAAQSVLDAGANAQTAMQKAAEATQSATNAAASATSAATSAETASTKAGEAAQSAQAVAETAEQLADSLEQIDQNTQDIAELDERKANIDGYYPDMTVGNAEQLNSSKYVENSEPYTFRTSGGSSDIGNREYLDAVVGGTVAWNQMVRDEASENSTDFAPIVTVDDAVEDAAGVKVKIEPVQDLHGYDHPWPAGGGKNLIVPIDRSFTNNGVPCVCSASAETVSLKGTANNSGGRTGKMTKDIVLPAGTYTLSITAVSGTRQATYIVNRTDNNVYISTSSFSLEEETSVYVGANVINGTVYDEVVRIQIEAGSTASDWTPYSNICPITGWDGVKVWDDPVHGGNVEWNQISQKNKNPYTSAGVTYAITNGVCTATGTATASSYTTLTENTIPGHVYLVSIKDATNVRMWLFGYSSEATNTSAIYKKTASSNSIGLIVANGVTVNETVVPQIFDLTQMLGETKADEIYAMEQANAGSGVAYFRSLFPADYYPYNEGEITTVSAVNGDPYRHYSITLPSEAGTVYGGELTVNEDGTGTLVVELAKRVINGNERFWAYASNETYAHMVFETPDSMKEQNQIMCDKLRLSGAKPYTNSGEGVWQGGSYTWYICVKKDLLESDDSAGFSQWLASNNLTCIYKLATPITYTLTASQIRTLLGQNNVWSDAGQIALTYTGTDEHLVLESGKKYLARISGTDSMLLGSGQEITAAKGTDNVFDLTQMFGTAVADYVYGQGAAFFRKWFPNARYLYSAGELKHVEGLQSHDMVGFNQWDEENVGTIVGSYRIIDIPVLHDNKCIMTLTDRNASVAVPSGTAIGFVRSDWTPDQGALESKDFRWVLVNNMIRPIRSNTSGGVATTEGNTLLGKMLIYPSNINAFNLIKQRYNICVNLAHNGSRNGEYAPYEKHSYPLDSTVVLRGIPKVGANGVYWDGDRYLPDGTVERRYGVVDLGTLTWGDNGNKCWVTNTIPDIKPVTDSSYTNRQQGVICTKYPADTQFSISGTAMTDKTWLRTATVFAVKDTAYENVAAFKAAMSGVYLVYELATPTTETAQPYHSTQWVSDWGTEEFVSTGIVPVGHETRYPANLRDKLQHLPDAASGNGSYLITQTDGQMVLTPFPAPPSTAGNYVLKATVTGGVATYTWEVAT